MLREFDCQETVPIHLSSSIVEKDGIKLDSFMVVGLEVCDPEVKSFIALTPVFTLDKLPVVKNDVITKEDLKEWLHLQGIDIASSDSDWTFDGKQ